MRMWMVDVKKMCRKHLLGEHVEIHMIVGSVQRDRSLDGFAMKNCLEFRAIGRRHEDIVQEMLARGYKHKSELPRILRFNQTEQVVFSKVNKEESLMELCRRCSECRKKFSPEN